MTDLNSGIPDDFLPNNRKGLETFLRSTLLNAAEAHIEAAYCYLIAARDCQKRVDEAAQLGLTPAQLDEAKAAIIRKNAEELGETSEESIQQSIADYRRRIVTESDVLQRKTSFETSLKELIQSKLEGTHHSFPGDKECEKLAETVLQAVAKNHRLPPIPSKQGQARS